MNIDFMELGTFCQNRYKESFEGKTSNYVKTLFVAIDEENNVYTSTTPHILKSATKCILIHEHVSLAVTNWYSWYKVEYINENGEVLDNRLDDEFVLSVVACGGYANQVMELSADQRNYFSCKVPWENSIKKVWQLYSRLKQTKSVSERLLISSVFNKDEKILEMEKTIEDFKFQTYRLEEESKTYKTLLDELKDIIKK